MCPKGGMNCSLMYQSIFSCSNLPMGKVLFLLYCWAHGFSNSLAAHETGVTPATVTFYYKQFRSACFDYVLSLSKRRIGGEGKAVEID